MIKLLLEAETNPNINDTKLIELLHDDCIKIKLRNSYDLHYSHEGDKYVFISVINNNMDVWLDVGHASHIVPKRLTYHIM